MNKRRPFLLALLALPLAARAQSDDWQTVVAPDLRCRLEMPSPAQKSEGGDKEKGHAGVRLSWESRRENQIFDFDYVDYEPGWFSGRDTKEAVRDLGRGEAEKAFPRAKFKYVRDEAVTLQGWDGYALDIEDANGAGVMMRTYIVRDRLYRLLVTAGGDMKSKSAAVRFVDSLKVAETK
ncbi:MAG: hypothetical protein JSR24_01835 [Proteobacteria bacterium]|nr:hypothetical protein [Pseudomonadota bacterium]